MCPCENCLQRMVKRVSSIAITITDFQCNQNHISEKAILNHKEKKLLTVAIARDWRNDKKATPEVILSVKSLCLPLITTLF